MTDVAELKAFIEKFREQHENMIGVSGWTLHMTLDAILDFISVKAYPTTAEAMLELFKTEMLEKLKLRAAKHPDDNFLALSVEDMQKYPLESIIDHANAEIEELYVARGFEGSVAVRKENVDNANMNFIEWALRKVREVE